MHCTSDGVMSNEDRFCRDKVLEDELFIPIMPSLGRRPDPLKMLTELGVSEVSSLISCHAKRRAETMYSAIIECQSNGVSFLV